jgi:hypothetical protein
MYIAHGPISYLLNEKLQGKKISKLNKSQEIFVALFSILFGILPDIDILLLRIVNIPSFLHHNLFTHSLLLYIPLWLLLYVIFGILKKILNNKTRNVFSDDLFNILHISFLIGTMSHFVSDILFSHSRILFPLEKQVTILGDIFKTNYFSNYIFTPTFAVEILFVFFFLLVIYKRYFKQLKAVKKVIYTFTAVTFLFLALTLYMNTKTYNKAFHFSKGMKVLDVDSDGIYDSYDWDTDNDGIDNILEVDKEKMINFVESISNGKYLVYNQKDLFNKISKQFGAFTSYRVISQAYFEQNLAIEPVLTEYLKKEGKTEGYKVEVSYPNTFYQYLLKYGNISNIDTPGGILFVLDSNGNVLNMGLVIDDVNVSMVLEDDSRLMLHTKREIGQEYSKYTVTVLSVP